MNFKTIICIYCALISPLGLINASKSGDKPNIIVILVDDLGKEWVSCYGSEDVKTPRIDQMAKDGVLFHNSYSMPACTPSRATILTGKYPYNSGWLNHWDVASKGVAYFDWRFQMTFAREMKELGYKTCAAGKWQINDFRIEPRAMEKHGFDEWLMKAKEPKELKKKVDKYYSPYLNSHEGDKFYENRFAPDLYKDFIIDFMKRNKDEPMCIYYPMGLTHTPKVATPDEPNATGETGKHKAMVRYTDKIVGELIDTVKELGIADKTIFIFTTDNGTTAKVDGGKINGTPFDGGKGNFKEHGTCMPFIVYGASQYVAKGVERDDLLNLADIYPTLVELGGGKIDESQGIDGHSLVLPMQNKDRIIEKRWTVSMGNRHAVLDEQGLRSSQSFTDRVIRDKQYKVYTSEDRSITDLYDLLNDPLEKLNIVNSKAPEHIAALSKFNSIIQNEMPEVDNRLPYTKRAANSWDISIEETQAKDAEKQSSKNRSSKEAKAKKKAEKEPKNPEKQKRKAAAASKQ